MALWGRSVFCQKVPRKVPPSFQQGSAKVPSGSLEQSVLGCQKVPRKVPPSFQQGSAKVSPRFHLVLWSRSVLGCRKVLRKVPPRFHQDSPSLVLSLVLWGGSVLGCQEVHLGVPKGSVEGSTKVSPRFHQGFTTVAQVS